jgi:hypothetical protein
MQKTITLSEQEWALVKEAITDLRESVSDDMMHFKDVSDRYAEMPGPVNCYAITAANDAADKVCQLDQLNAKLITEAWN